MAKIKQQFEFSNLKDNDQIVRFLDIFSKDLTQNINGNLEFDENLRTSTVSVVFGAANTTQQVKHGLNRIPKGYILARSNVSVSLYDGVGENDTNFVYLKSTAPANIVVVVF